MKEPHHFSKRQLWMVHLEQGFEVRCETGGHDKTTSSGGQGPLSTILRFDECERLVSGGFK